MNRTEFIKSLISFFGISVLPAKWVKQYQKIYLLQCFVRGFQFYEGAILLPLMKEGNMLELVRDPHNEYDPCAIALYYNGHKIGFIPRESNEILSRLLDSDLVELHAEITHLEPAAKTWENVHIAIYLLKEIHEPLPDDKQYLTDLETPRYLTLKKSNDIISRVQINTYPEVYPDFNNNSLSCMDSEAGGDTFPEEAFKEILSDKQLLGSYSDIIYVINRKRALLGKELEDLLVKIDGEILELDSFFGDEGYVVANMDHMAQYPELIEGMVEVTDKYGNRVTEIVIETIG